MNDRPILFGTSWKMNKTRAQATAYMRTLLPLVNEDQQRDGIQIFILPPFTAIETVRLAGERRVWVGAQNMHWAESGAFTGEVSPLMLQELGVELVEIGHSERRSLFGETDLTVNLKVCSALRHGLRALICVGETAEDKKHGVSKETVARQLRIALKHVNKEQADSLIIAYEPVWAIGGTGSNLHPEYVYAISTCIREVLSDLFQENCEKVSVIYGGAVHAQNAHDLLWSGGVDGLFIGRAAWEAESFAQLIRGCLSNIP